VLTPVSRVWRALARAFERLAGRAAEERARTSEQRLDLALEASAMAIWELDPDTGAMWWSADAERLIGGRPGTLAEAQRAILPEDRPGLDAAIADALARPGVLRAVQFRVARPGGPAPWLEARGRAAAEGAGVRLVRGSLVDVTEPKRVEEGLRRNLDEMRVLAAVADAVASAPDEDTLLGRVTALLRGAFFPDNCGFLLHSPEEGVLRHAPSFHAARGRGALAPIEIGAGIVGAVFTSGSARRVDDTGHEPRYVALDPGMRSEICVPLEVGGRVIGVFDAESARLSAFGDADGRLLTVVASQVAGAIERLRADRARRASEDLYRACFSASPVALFVSDGRGRHLEVNAAASELTGYSREELAVLSVEQLEVGDGRARPGGPPSRILSAGGGEVRIRSKDGRVRHCLVHATSIDADRLLGTLLDITDRREAEERLRESEERFRCLSEASLEAIYVHDGGRVVDVNQTLCDMTGYAWHELIGRDGFELVAPEYRELAYRRLLAEADEPYEIECVRRDGTRLPVELQARSFAYRGRILRVVVARDITVRREAAAVRESLVRALEQKNAELERFSHAVTHELKEPLITVRGFADQVERDAKAGRTDRLVGDVERIADAARRVHRMLDELLAVTQAARPLGPPAAVPVEELVREARQGLASRFGPAGPDLDLASPLPVVYGDRARLLRAFQHLLDNAAKFRAASGRGRVCVAAVGSEGGRATIAVRDDGIGIDPRHQERVFDVFEKLDPRSEGRGVGLAVVRRIVESHGGRVWVESGGPGEGTVVYLTLPTPPSGQRTPPVAAGPSGPGR
jgi:PAS domain S-box-containing protein